MTPTLDERIRRAEETSRLIAPDSPLTRAFEALEERCVTDWKNSNTSPEAREIIHQRFVALRELRNELSRVIGDGSFARREADRAERSRTENINA